MMFRKIGSSKRRAAIRCVGHWFIASGILAFCCLSTPQRSAAAPGVREAVVKIYTVHANPNYDLPWSMLPPSNSTASGCIIAGNLILTNAHAVANQTFVQVRRHGLAEKFSAKVRAVSHTADLALLTVVDPVFAEGVTPLEFGTLPEVQSEVVVYGFPTGGDSLSSTRGVISRVEHRTYVHSSNTMLAAQIDAAVNPGNSGGPVLAGEKIVGIVMQTLLGTDGIGYMVPVPVIKHFLADLEDGRNDGFPSVGLDWQPMENESLRLKFGLSGKETGVLVNRVVPGSPGAGIILPGDVITALDGRRIAGDGTVEIRTDERTDLDFMIQDHQIGETVAVDLVRAGTKKSLKVALTTTIEDTRLVPYEQYDLRPSYFVYGGFVFQPLTMNYFLTWGDEWVENAPRDLVATLLHDIRSVADEQVVVLVNVMPAEVNRGYGGTTAVRIVSVNGRKINNLAELVRFTAQGDGNPFTLFESNRGAVFTLDRNLVAASTAELLKQYQIPSDRSPDLPAAEALK